MRKQTKKVVMTLLVTCMCLNTFISNLQALNTNNLDDYKVEGQQTLESKELQSNTYRDYYARFCEFTPVSQEALVEINQSLLNEPVEFSIQISQEGLYTIGMEYKALGSEISDIQVDLKVDGINPFLESKELCFPRIWADDSENRVDGLGNEFAPKQIPYNEYCFQKALDVTGWTAEPYCVFMTAGEHKITLAPVSGEVDISYFKFGVPENHSSYQAPEGNGVKYDGKTIHIEGENPLYKNSYWLSSKTDNSSVNITPNSTSKNLVNYIGGGNWKNSGETIVWETPELSEGYYNIGFSFRQSSVIGGKTYRKMTIDGKVPFKEASAIGFSYDYDWQQSMFSDNNENPYLIYLTEGKHEIALTCVPGDIAQVREVLNEAVSDLGELYVEMTMITGETVDVYRDYNLFSQIPDMQQRLEDILKLLNSADELLENSTGQKSGSHSSVLKSMIQAIDQMLKNKYTAHRYKNLYYDKYCAVSSVLNEMRDMPLDIDKLLLVAPSEDEAFEKVSVLKQMAFSVKRFFHSFYKDYNSISDTQKYKENITVWINSGRDQAQVLNSMAKANFNTKQSLGVNVELVNVSIVQAMLSGKTPDCILQYSRSEPVNLAMRDVLLNLEQFDDLDNVLSRFQNEAELPYRYKDGLYSLPDTQVFYLMYYRKDILDQLGIPVPETWEDFNEVCKLITRNNLTVWLPNKPATDISQVNSGIGSANLFPSILLQNDISLYSENGKSTNLSKPDVMMAFEKWTDYYRKLKLPKALDFYNRFRTGTCPIGIEQYTTYTTLKAAAPEIDGLWGVTAIPGTLQEDGTVSRVSSGGGTACAILKNSKNPEGAWEFLKWWTSEETQLSYSNEVESILGPSGRIALSNVNAFKKQSWDKADIDSILYAWNLVKEVPEYPGSYYVSRSLYHSFWNVVDNNKTPKDMLLKYSKEADAEIARKWKQYEYR